MKNRIKILINTTAVRLSLKYSLIYIAVFGIAFLFLYWFISSFVQDQIKGSLMQENKRIETIYAHKGSIGIKKYIIAHQQYKGEDHKYYLLMDKNGHIIAGDLNKWPSSLTIDRNVHNIWIAEENIKGKVEDGDGYWPMIALKFKNGSKMLIGQGIKGSEDLRETMFAVMAFIFGIIVILTIALGLSLGKNVLRHIDNINSAYKDIMRGDLSSRISISQRKDEFDTISEQLNKMLDKIEHLINEGKQITDNIAHDLRIPLNRIRNRLEITLLNKSKYDCDDILEKTIGDIDNIIKTFNSILQIAQAESEAAKKSWEKLDINNVILNVADMYDPLIEDKSIKLNMKLSKNLIISGNKYLITQAISNIIDNAVKYTKNIINISAYKDSSSLTILVCDNGTGIDVKDYENITKPFERLDSSRHTPGNGLGLSLVKAVADLHKAKLMFKNNKPGLCVELVF